MGNIVIDQLVASPNFVSVCWLGNLSWLIHSGGQVIAFDLDLDHDLRLRPSPVATEEIAPILDVLFITHEHGDHFNAVTGAILAQRSRCTFVVPASCEAKARNIGVPEERLRIARPREPFDLLGIHVRPIRALHGDRHQTVYRHANLDDCGYVLTLGGQRLLQPGDSVLLQDHMDLGDIDILFVSPTDHNMAIERSALLIETLKPRVILPQHFGTYKQTAENLFWTRGLPDELRAALSDAMRAGYHRLEQGEVLAIAPAKVGHPEPQDGTTLHHTPEDAMPETKEYLYRVQPTRPAMLVDGPTPDEAGIISEHFTYLESLTEAGTVILAGRTLNTDPSSFGIVIFRADSPEQAQAVMENDPAVRQGVMQAVLFPYSVALLAR
ncbi:MAG: MBL fold metallo-hydrolase [Anaerolineae bacterium]|jgi:L-ascorbate metabolism protein UlaG (beta-lactamase superfamily)/uncharacterized protein YciI|nr:MBL fold metallo-hydrolase [Anaerolineae bacterium]